MSMIASGMLHDLLILQWEDEAEEGRCCGISRTRQDVWDDVCHLERDLSRRLSCERTPVAERRYYDVSFVRRGGTASAGSLAHQARKDLITRRP